MNISLGSLPMERLEQYFEELQKWQAKVNLVSKSTTPEQLIDGHFLDSLALVPFFTSGDDRLLDIGSGAGFPGLVCKAACDYLQVTLVEPRAKRASFLRHVIRLLGLDGVEVLECRIEDEQRLPSTRRFTHITARAVADLGVVLAMAQRFSGSSPDLLWLKGPKWRDEFAAGALQLQRSPYQLAQTVEYRLPVSGALRYILVFTTKECKTTGDNNEKSSSPGR